MTLSATLQFRDPVSQDVDPQIGKWARIAFGNQVTIYDLRNSFWQDVFDVFESAGLGPLRMSPTIIEREAFDWQMPSEEWEGAVVGADHVQNGANPPADYDPVLPQPCRGWVRGDRPIQVHERPQGHVAAVGEQLVYSRDFVRIIADPEFQRSGEVHFRGQPLPNWFRANCTRHCRAIAPESLGKPLQCATCGTLLVPKLGVWIAEAGAKVAAPIAEDESGFDHRRQNHALVISLDRARQLSRLQRSRGYSLSLLPVYRRDSQTASVMLELLERAAGLMTE